MRHANCLVAALCVVAGTAHAQSSVTLYGSTDAGVGYASNLRGHSSFFAQQGTYQADRWGLTGIEDLGGGLKTVFKLESGFSTINGSMSSAGVLFNRQAFVGLSDNRFGTLTLGRMTDWNFEMLGPFSTGQSLGNFSAFHPANIDGLGNTVPSEWSNAVKFRSPAYGGLSFGAMYGFPGASSSSTAGRSYSLGVNYANGPLKLAATYSEYHDRTLNLNSGFGLTNFGGINLANGNPFVADSVKELGVGGSYEVGKVLLHAVATQVRVAKNGASENFRAVDAGANFHLTPAEEIDVGGWGASFDGGHWAQLTVANVYALSKATQVYVDVSLERASSSAIADTIGVGPSSTNKQIVVLTGIHHLF
ncbi:porin [Trinickia dinghuensis]|uniref:Porin n=2 Tax=Trinickia dinghuensis TaxID=2291023 RepID=A0A3D8JUV7_9BURK|nr:porin [Trinickia dinghuensis]